MKMSIANGKPCEDGGFVISYPTGVNVDERIMRDVDRVRNIA